MSQSFFQKFQGKKKNSVIKEEFKQAKKKAKKEKAAAINKRFEERRQMRQAMREERETSDVKRETRNDKTSDVRHEGSGKIGNKNKLQNNRAFREKVVRTKVDSPTKVLPSAISSDERTNKKVTGNEMPLNKYLAHCGVCSRRDAVALVKEGKVKVNNAIITEPAFKVNEKDDIIFNGKKLFISKDLVYILLNKPKDYITTTDDPQGRKTVLQLTKWPPRKGYIPWAG